VWAHFSDPLAHGGRDFTIHAELQRLISKAPRGATIRGTIHSLDIDSVADALVTAQTNGVNVWVVIDGKNTKSTDPAVTTIKRLDHYEFCNNGGGHGCISTSSSGDMHTKMFTFTSTTDPTNAARSNVSWFGSPNMTDHSGPDDFNNAITVYGDATLAAGLNANFADLWAQRHYSNNDYYDSASGRGYYQAAAADAYASPERSGQTDTIVTRLNDMAPDANCRLRIGMANVTSGRPELVSLVKNYRKAGCQVWMVVGTDGSDISMNQGVYDDLIKAGVKIHKIAHVHDKYFLAYGKFGGSYQYRVYTGSQNWTEDALSQNDEIFVKMAPETGTTHPLYDGYYAHFNDAYNNGDACTADHDSCY
jgi:phosphatidylserine/phosphatidylglycerophosphate/cardiolipin synthase-like enzyme